MSKAKTKEAECCDCGETFTYSYRSTTDLVRCAKCTRDLWAKKVLDMSADGAVIH